MSDNYKSNEPSTDASGDREILERIDEGVRRYYQANSPNIERFRSEREFLFITQWMQSEIAGFQQLNKPIFTYNKLYDYYKKLIGEQRYNTSSLEVRSKNLNNENISQEEVTLRADIIRGIEYRSRAHLAYQNAFGNAVSGGMGFFRLRTDYISPKSFLQEIYIEKEPYADRVFYDPSATAITKTDGSYMGRYDTMSRKDFEDKYPDVPYPRSFPSSFNLELFTWGDKDEITICEYYEKEWYSFNLYQLDNGECVTEKEYNKRKKEYEKGIQSSFPSPENDAIEKNSYEEALDAQMSQGMDNQNPPQGAPQPDAQTPMAPQDNQAYAKSVEMPAPVDQMPSQQPPMPQQAPSPMMPTPLMAGIKPFPEKVGKPRKSRDYKIVCYKAIFGKVLETYEWPGKEFPLIAVMGGEEYVKGRPVTTSLTTYARDPQRFFNFLVSDLAQAAKNNRREQFLVTPDNIAGFENFWSQPGNVLGGLLYNPDGITKEKPERLPPADLPQSLLANLQQADRDMRSIIGYPQDNSDSRSFGQLTGKAIREMQRVGNSANLIFFDNLKAAQEQMGKAILSMIPIVYDTERTISAHGIDGKARDVVVNKKIAGKISNDLSKGDFDVTVTAAANYAVQREEALQTMIELTKLNPEVFALSADIIAENIDIEKGVELVKRFKTLVPPQALGQPAPPQQPDPQQQMEQQLAQAKLQIEAAKVQGEQEKTQAQRELNQVKMEQAQVEMQSSKIRAYGELQKAGLDYKAQMAQAAAKVASAHADISDKHFEAMKHIHNLTQDPLRPKEELEAR